ncbi:MAG: site-2 protease family protein [bacterium]|nr:site-2 protease family protein [bacterium]
MNWELAALWFVTFIVSVTIHEAAHGWFAKLGGDPTAYNAGLVTINPLPHIQRSPFGMLVIPIGMLLMTNGEMCFGGASAPIDPIWAYHNPKKAAAMSAAGPLSNLLLAAVAFATLYFIARPDGDTMVAIRKIAGIFLLLNLLLCILNLFPLPPFDGASVVAGLSRSARQFYNGLERIPYIQIVALVAAFYSLRFVFWPVFNEINGWLPYPWRY